MNSKSKGRNIWTSAETKLLLSLLKERKIISKLDGKEYRHSYLMQLLSGDMHNHNQERTAEQIKTRLKNLRDKYNKCKEALQKSGSGNIEWEYYDDMNELYGCRPSSMRKGLDSANSGHIEKISAVTQKADIKTSNSFSPSTSGTKDTFKEMESPEITQNENNFETSADFPVARKGTLDSHEFNDETLDTNEFEEENLRHLPLSPREEQLLNKNDKKSANCLDREIEFESFNSPEINVEKDQWTAMRQEMAGDGNEEESAKIKRKRRRDDLEKEKEETIENLELKRAENTKMILDHQEKIQKQSTEEWKTILQQNSLLLIQALGVLQSSATSPKKPRTECECSNSVHNSSGSILSPFQQRPVYYPFYSPEQVYNSYTSPFNPYLFHPNNSGSQMSGVFNFPFANVQNCSVLQHNSVDNAFNSMQQNYQNNINLQNNELPMINQIKFNEPTTENIQDIDVSITDQAEITNLSNTLNFEGNMELAEQCKEKEEENVE